MRASRLLSVLLTLQTRSRVFQQKTVKEILGEVIGGLYAPDLSRLTADYFPRNFCAQYRETDFAFISRLMEEAGIYYFFEHTDSDHTMVVGNDVSTFSFIHGTQSVVFNDFKGLRDVRLCARRASR